MPSLASHPLRSRVGLLVPSPAAQVVWTGTANGAQSASFVLAVTTGSGSLAAVKAGMVVVTADGDYIRAKLDAAGGNLYLAENFTEFAAGDVLTAYNIRLPWPRYQRLDGETLYKDWDVAFPADFRDVLPPSVVVEPGCVWAVVGTAVAMDADGSLQVNDPDVGNYVDITWDAGAWGTVTNITGSHGQFADVTANTAGWHYLKVTGADEFGATAVRYVAFVAGGTPLPVLSFDLNWTLAGGWTASGTVDGSLAGYLRHSPAVLVDLDTRAVLFAGFLTAEGLARVVNVDTASFKLLAALAEAEKLTTHAFIVTDLVETATPDSWEEVRKLTVERALWYLLYWQTLIPELINVRMSGYLPVRRIKGQKFQAGGLPALINEVLGAAMQVLRGQRTGGVDVAEHPLFTAPEAWGDGTLPVLDLSSPAAREAAVDLESPQDAFSDCVLSGVYLQYAGDYAPARMRAPAHPAPWGGRTATVDRLAPTSEYELQLWAARHFCNENLSTRATIRPLITVDPGAYALVDTGQAEAARIAIESLRETFNVGGAWWGLQLSGRNYAAATFTAVSEPLPDPITVTPTPAPVPVPPIPFVPPVVVQEWPVVVYVATRADGVFYTADFGGPDDPMPTWARLNTLDGGGTLTACDCLHVVPGGAYQYVITARNSATGKVYRRTNGAWYKILDAATFKTTYAAFASGWSTARFSWIASYGSTLYVMMTAGSSGMKLIYSGDYGDTWALLANIPGWAYSAGAGAGNFIIDAGAGYMVVNRAGSDAGGTYYYSNAGMTTWSYTSSEYGTSNYMTGMHRINGESYLHAYLSNGGDYERLLRRYDTGYTPPFNTPAASDWGMIPTNLRDGWPFMVYADGVEYLVPHGDYADTNRLITSDDLWATKTVPAAAIGRTINMIYSSPYVATNFILGRAVATATNVDAHHVYVSAGGVGITDRSGASASNPATTDSIPYDCGGICPNGIGIVE